MRLSETWRRIIREAAEEVFGPGTRVLLFGSRADPTRKGGDIDLYIVPGNPPREPEELFQKKTRFLSRLWTLLGEQKIDVVIARDPERPIERAALEEGLPL